ncbi:hypothetical protein [Hymenobacter cellulosilyticus]|uniref:Uncharacterized protein n=1 Tax=Hymenobacter cellulosilyticus TaxID=2932248 RepID=A0A8T9Q647_9BACT|nr:hypothetical protein [Hymenobacter cellulosilyticus]UOQ71458.1 hypothetical protein MUN79_23015 [Hymenobacter cellulosilyticus]
MKKYILLASLAIGGVSQALGQTVIQGDSMFLGLQIRKSSVAQVKAQLGNRYRAEKIVSVGTEKTRDGQCITTKRVTGVSMHFRKQGLICFVNTNTTKWRQGLALIEFDSTANVSSAKGIQPGKHRFSDVIAQYGPIDFDKKDNSLPAAQEISNDGEHWYTVLVFPTIRFISPGKKQPGENLLLRPVTGIWLENQY